MSTTLFSYLYSHKAINETNIEKRPNAMSKLLLVVDPQIDFITGTLPVPGAEEALAPLAQFITDSNGEYGCSGVVPWQG